MVARDISRRKEAERALRDVNTLLEQRVAERTEEARRLADQLRTLAVELTQSEQRERKRIATILHDHIQQPLVSARLRVDRLKNPNAVTFRVIWRRRTRQAPYRAWLTRFAHAGEHAGAESRGRASRGGPWGKRPDGSSCAPNVTSLSIRGQHRVNPFRKNIHGERLRQELYSFLDLAVA